MVTSHKIGRYLKWECGSQNGNNGHYHYLRTIWYITIITIVGYSTYNSTPYYLSLMYAVVLLSIEIYQPHKNTKKHLSKING
jgi:hypothetical protein